MPIRILLADDHTLVRDGLRALLEGEPDFTVVASVATGRAAVQMARELKPEVALKLRALGIRFRMVVRSCQ